MRKLTPYASLLLAGFLYAFGFPTFLGKTLFITPIIGSSILFYFILNTRSLVKQSLYVLTFNLSFNLLSFYWIASTLKEFGELPYIIASLMASLFTLLITPYLWVALLAIKGLFHVPLFVDFFSKEKLFTNGLYSLLFASLLTLVEHYTPAQFPTHIGSPWVALGKWLGYASVGGLPIYSFFSYLVVFESVGFATTRRFSKLNMISVLLFIITNPFLNHKYQPSGKELNVRVVQANISNFLKLDSESGSYPSVKTVIKRYKDLSMQSYPSGEKPDLIIWPETAYPYSIYTDKNDLSNTLLPGVFQEIISYWQTEMFIGGYDNLKRDKAGDYYQTEYNAAFLFSVDKQVKDVYHKQILIPFGETLPLGPLTPYVAKYIRNIAFFSVGEKFTLFKLATGHKVIAAICYEVLKADYIREYLNQLPERPHALINITNDSWYGDTAEPEQHLFLTKWRALENQLPIIRSTNTGITSIIYPDGSESARLPVGYTGNLDLSLKLAPTLPTVYQRFGFLTLLPLWLLYFIFHQVLLKLYREEN